MSRSEYGMSAPVRWQTHGILRGWRERRRRHSPCLSGANDPQRLGFETGVVRFTEADQDGFAGIGERAFD